MCQAKPGPRCAGHLSEQIARVQQQLAENRDAYWADGHHQIPHPSVSAGTLAVLQDEYDETPTGQRALDAEILTHADQTPAAEAWRRELQIRKDAAAGRYEAKKAALQATEEGKERRAKTLLKYGANNGWLEHSALHPLSVNAFNNMHVENGEAYGYDWSDTYIDRASGGMPAEVTEYGLIFETPVSPGPTPGTWITGTPASRAHSDPLLFTESDLDHPHATLRSYDPASGQPYGEPVTLDDLDVPSRVNEFTGHRTSDEFDESWDEPTLVRDEHGTPVLLQYTGVGKAYRTHEGRAVA